MHDRTKGLMQSANAKKLEKRVSNVWKRLSMLFLNNDKQVTLWEVKSFQKNILSKDLIKHANKVLW
jgi:hypothetical protein